MICWCQHFKHNMTLKSTRNKFFITFRKILFTVYSIGVQTILPKEPNYMGTKNSSIQNVYKNFGPRSQIWLRSHVQDNPALQYTEYMQSLSRSSRNAVAERLESEEWSGVRVQFDPSLWVRPHGERSKLRPGLHDAVIIADYMKRIYGYLSYTMILGSITFFAKTDKTDGILCADASYH